MKESILAALLLISVGSPRAATLPSALPRASLLGVVQAPDGSLIYQHRDLGTGQVTPRPLTPAQAAQLTAMLERLGDQDPGPQLAERLSAFLPPQPWSADVQRQLAGLFTTDGSGRTVLTEQGKAFLMDIFLASDGDLGRRTPPPANPQHLRAQPPAGQPQDGPNPLAAVVRAGPAVSAPEQAFDNAGYRLGAFDWAGFHEAVAAPGGPSALGSELSEAYAINDGMVRVLVSARGPTSTRLQVGDAGAEEEAYREAGLDPELFRRHGARVLRSLGDPRNGLLVLDVPLPQAGALGQRLREQNVESRPSRVYQAVSAAFTLPPAAFLGVQFLPIPGLALGSIFLQADRIQSRLRLDVGALHRLPGGQGQQALVGIIDSGVYAGHPDFRDRISAYTDLTPEADNPDKDKKDFVGHGTHVAGIIGGSGASGGPQGAAPQARLKVAKVFYKARDLLGREVTRTSEDILLAAMHWMQETGARPDVLNLSLGSPAARIEDDPLSGDPLSVAVNRAVARDNMLVVVAAGNDGARGASTVGRPGSARYAFSVAATDNDARRAFYSSYGPVLDRDGRPISPGVRVTARGGGIDMDLVRQLQEEARRRAAGQNPHEFAPLAAGGRCIYGPGVLAPRSPDDGQPDCALAGNPGYRYMSGTSMATPQITGMAADIVSYLRANGRQVNPFEIQALMMETADDLRLPVEQQGAGLANGERIAAAVVQRVSHGLPVGNIAYELALRLTSADQQALGRQSRYRMTPLGLWDTRTGHLVNREEDLRVALAEIRRSAGPELVRRGELPVL